MQEVERPDKSSTEDRRYRLLVEAVTDYAIYMLDPDGIVTSWNPGAQKFKGYEAAEILGRHFSCFYTEEDRRTGLPARALETAAREGRFESEGWRVRKDGGRFWANVIIDPIREPSGQLVGFAKVTRDLTERRQVEDSLRRSQEQFRLLVDGVADHAIYMLDPQGRITNWNLGAQRIKGYYPDEIIGESFARFYTEEDRARGEPQRALEIAAAEGRYGNVGRRVRKDGSEFWADVVIHAIRNEAGALLGFAKITRDVTERREARAQLETAREQLFQSQKMEAVGQLTGGIAHDFNNLLMAILGSLELLRKRLPDQAEFMRLIDNAIAGAQRGASLTQRMLAFSRRQTLDPETVDVPALVHGMSEFLQRSLGPSNPIETRFPATLAPVRADANQLELALLNLAVNARDAMPQGGTIVIAAREESVHAGSGHHLESGPHVCLSVTDTGEGMDAATLARAREPFFTTKGVGKGTGLGLSAVHGVMEQSGGELVLKSTKGKGTTAELWLPVASGDPARDRMRPGAEPDPAGTGRPLAVLAVEDDSLVLMNTAAMLEDLGHSVLEATSGDEALEILRREPRADLVITDQAMPRMTGTQLIEAVKAEWPGVAVILATGYAELPADADPATPRLDKPFTQQALANAIARCMPAAQAAGGQAIGAS
jgi:PAS domain S-box-containing protein